MHITNLKKIGGSIMVAVPPALLDLLHLQAGAIVAMAVDGHRLIIEAKPPSRYTLAELLAVSDYSQQLSPEERRRIDAPPAGRELI